MKARCLLVVACVAMLGGCSSSVTAPTEVPTISTRDETPAPAPIDTTTRKGGGSMGNGN